MKEVQLKVGHDQADSVVVSGQLVDGVLQNAQFIATGCLQFLRLIQSLREQSAKTEVTDWSYDKSDRHITLLLSEIKRKILGVWDYPYPHDELCHCRVVRTEMVDRAIVTAASDADKVAEMTSAGTGCGTCVKDTKELIRFREEQS